MNQGTALAVFLIVFREALEASLIIAIILTTLSRLHQKRYFPHVYGSVFAAFLLSVAAGWALNRITAEASEWTQTFIEGAISLVACGVLTYMVFWMNRQARLLKSEIESNVEHAISKGELFALMALPFLAVFREGAETVLYLAAVSAKDSGSSPFWGCTLGLGLAILIVFLIFGGGKRIPLKPLFQVSGNFLLIIAAGMLAYGIHEFHEISLIPEVYAPVWDINHILNDKKGTGAFLKALFGYNGNPSLVEVVAYFGFLAGVGLALKRKGASAAQ